MSSKKNISNDIENNFDAIEEFKNSFRSIFKNAEHKIKDKTKVNSFFGKLMKLFYEADSLKEHKVKMIGQNIVDYKSTNQNLEDNGLLKKSFYRNEDRLFRILAEALKDPKYTLLLESRGFKDFIEMKKKGGMFLFENDEIGLTLEFLGSSYFSNLLDDKNFANNLDNFLFVFSKSQLEDMKAKLKKRQKDIAAELPLTSVDLIGTLKNSFLIGTSGFSLAAGVKVAFLSAVMSSPVGIFIAVTVALAVALVPVISYLFKKAKIQILNKQARNIGIIKIKIEEVLENKTKNSQKNIKHNNENEKIINEKTLDKRILVKNREDINKINLNRRNLIENFKNEFQLIFQNAKFRVQGQTKNSSSFGKLMKTFYETDSLKEHKGTQIGRNIAGYKSTAQNLEDNNLLDKTFYRNEDRLFRILAEALKDPSYIDLLKSDGFKYFIEEKETEIKQGYFLFKNDEIGLTGDFIGSSYFSNLLDNDDFANNLSRFFSAFSNDQLRDMNEKLKSRERVIPTELPQISADLFSTVKSSFLLAIATFSAATAAKLAFLSAVITNPIFLLAALTVTLAVALVPFVCYLFKKAKIQMLNKQALNISAMKTKIKDVLKNRESKNKENRGENRLS